MRMVKKTNHCEDEDAETSLVPVGTSGLDWASNIVGLKRWARPDDSSWCGRDKML